jgi:syntaxin 1B/2/3
MFQGLDTAVQLQDPSVVCVEHNAGTTHTHVEEANIEIDQANKKARTRKRTKWWCLLVSLLVVAVTGVIIALVTKR